MSNKTNTKIRLVRCPRCQQVLPELPEVPLYECGGCGAHLQAKNPKNGTMDATSQKMNQPFDDTETGSTSNQRSPITDGPHRNDTDDHHEPRSSTDLSCQQDPESSPEPTAHLDTDEEHHIGDDIDVKETDIDVSKDSNGGARSNFKSLIAEKLLDTSLRKASSGSGSRRDEDDSLSEYESANLSLQKSGRGFERVSSFETLENVGFGNTSYYGYEGSESSYDEKEDLRSRKNHFGYKGLTKSDTRGATWRLEHQPIDVRSVYGIPGPSRGGFDEFDGNSRYRSSQVAENPKLEKLELLKMVQKLQDQLDRTTVSNAHPRYPGRYSQRMAFSGNAAPLDGNRVMSPCHHCCAQERPFSAQLPSQAICYHHSHYGAPYVNPGPYHSPRFSSHSSPQRSEFSALSHETKTVDFRHRTDVPNLYLPEKHHPPRKRHVRPIGEGAPFITCYRCLERLQMPQSFLLFKRRYHSLRCGACSKILKFTVSNGSRVARYFPEETITAPPSSEAGDYPGSSRVGPISCSDNSFPKSYSTETDRNSHSFQVRTFDWNSSERKMSSSEFPAKKKVVSEIEEIEPASSAPPLHRLMGYTSPSKVIHS